MKLITSLFLALIIPLTGCVTAPPARAPLNLPQPAPLSLRPVKWIVHPVEQKDGKIVVMFSLTDAGYKNLSLNVQDIIQYLTVQRLILDEYRQYYEGSDNP